MSSWSLPVLLASLHDDIQHRLQTTRKSFGHPDAKGDASEAVWLELLKTYLPERYRADKAYVVDSKGAFSDQIDVVVYDRQYSPFIFHYQGETIVPAESVYAIFEAKQTINANYVTYARKKVASVRTLHRTSLPIPHAGGTYPPKPLYTSGTSTKKLTIFSARSWSTLPNGFCEWSRRSSYNGTYPRNSGSGIAG